MAKTKKTVTKRKLVQQKRKDTVKDKRSNKVLSVQRYMQFAGAHDDTLVLKNGGIRAVLEIGSVNFNLKSEEEQNAIIRSYQQFLNALNFPTQILVRSQKLDIDLYILKLKKRLKEIDNELLRQQMREYIEYITKLVQYSDIMDKRFYCIIPVDPIRAEQPNMLTRFWRYISPDDSVGQVMQRRREFKELKKQLDSRVGIATTALGNCGLSVKRLQTAKIIELLYQSYNPGLSRSQKFTDMDEVAVSAGAEENLVAEDA